VGEPTSVTLEADVFDELRTLAQSSGKPLDAFVSAVLRDYLRRNVGHSSTSDRVESMKRADEALTTHQGFSREESIARARSAVERARSMKCRACQRV
jgi:hypothetical protein